MEGVEDKELTSQNATNKEFKESVKQDGDDDRTDKLKQSEAFYSVIIALDCIFLPVMMFISYKVIRLT